MSTHPSLAVRLAPYVPTAFEALLRDAGLRAADALLLAAVVDRGGVVGLDADGLASILLRYVNRSNRAAYREGYEDASEILSGTRQSPLLLPDLTV